MLRMSTMISLAAVALVATPMVVGAASTASPSEPIRQAAASVEVAAATVPAQAIAAPAATTTSPCTRKVKVVYAGYGEARSSCAETPR
jgi:hypothetical protein